MYGIDSKDAFSFLEGAELDQLGFGLYQVGFSMNGGEILLGVESAMVLEAEERFEIVVSRSREEVSYLNDAGVLLRLVGKTVTGVAVEHPGILTLSFGDNLRLQILDNSDQYESFTVSRKGHPLIVV